MTRFAKCNGNNNKASLETTSSSIQGTIPITLAVQNPPIHSEDTSVNTWLLQLFRGAEAQPSNEGTAPGYKIRSMTATYMGNNRLGGTSSGFIKFKPNQLMPKGGSLVIYPPAGQGYNLLCQGVHQVSLPEVPNCLAKGVDQPLTLELSDYTLQANFE